MSFCFNFSIPEDPKTSAGFDEKELQKEKTGEKAERIEDNTSPDDPVKEAKEHFPPPNPQLLLTDAVFETVTIGSLPSLHFLNETVFEKTISEREDTEKILSSSKEQKSDLISGVYEGGLKVWECTYDLLEQIENNGETFRDKAVLDLGCGAGLLGILALKRGARQVHFQDYNSTVIEQLTVPNVILNCQEDEEGEKNDIQGRDGCEKEVEEIGNPPPKKRATDMPQHTLLRRCFFFSGNWRTFLPLVLTKEPQPKFDIIFTSETIYNTAYYPALHEALQKLLASNGLVYLATKSHYFGVGGGLHLFETFVKEKGVFSLDHLWDGEEGLQRHVVVLRFKKYV
ncbi:histidine protein methyltransferase 1 homolog [Oryzias melastigma]|uniref:histidine protein methyltransferase 1 homolog n=1 Tax=Oryzias melastigma TaxID=30732 RepID=UPI00168CBEF5|nr:histidine protein methyltransferase 1 homolog [Oryzias melastigma]